MSAVLTNVLGDLAGKLIIDEDADTTAETHVTGTTGSMYMVQIDTREGTANILTEANADTACYVKFVDASSNVTGGGGSSSTPSLVLYAPMGKITTYVISGGWAFSSGLSFWAVTTAATAGDDSPTLDVKVTIISS
tara:strand:- start:1940 stop:2347 length:408 start_codon:yes stop_codon:yes gene_type:complete